jgi:hypothetical protein
MPRPSASASWTRPADDPKTGKRIVMAHPAYDQCIKASHLFNLLDARGVISSPSGRPISAASARWPSSAPTPSLESADLFVTTLTGEVLTLTPETFEGIDADTSPLRFRVCFTLDEAGLAAAGQGAPVEEPTPLTAPGWFDCFDAAAIGAALEAGEAEAVLGERNARAGVDRVFAVFPDGRVYGWHQLNGTLE